MKYRMFVEDNEQSCLNLKDSWHKKEVSTDIVLCFLSYLNLKQLSSKTKKISTNISKYLFKYIDSIIVVRNKKNLYIFITATR